MVSPLTKHARILKSFKDAHDRHARDVQDFNVANVHHAILQECVAYPEQTLGESADKDWHEIQALKATHFPASESCGPLELLLSWV